MILIFSVSIHKQKRYKPVFVRLYFFVNFFSIFISIVYLFSFIIKYSQYACNLITLMVYFFRYIFFEYHL